MFMLFGPGAQCACLAGVVVAGSACLYCTYRQIMACPHPTEWQPLGDVCYAVGCHTHRKFNLVVEIHEADRMGKGKFQFEAELGRTNGTTEVMEKDGKINQALHLHCRWGLIKNEELAFLEIPVEPELTENQPPKAIGPKCATRIGSELCRRDFASVLPRPQEGAGRRFYSRALDGPVQKMNALGDKWQLAFYKNEADIANVERTIMFKQVDRDRDIWVDGMYDFIEQFREFKDDERDKKSAKKEKLEAKKQRQEAKASGNEADESDGGAIRKKATKKAGAKKKHNKEESGTEAATATGAGTPSESEALLSEAPKKRVTKKK
uniref:CERLI1-like PH domain-containing protein n=1 Tax=Chromera velia CCMP2878 TaxID=1169474 RepID=A0A0G4GHK9_9ALVE|eukprot:Cvel_21914.t1-p1 / transcript=Cvel_21914.t1 / gene=Cvel_21914 / organism=Chromera_velia_CCMP2878 / gene_product=hypothetical protein / transcript_product=hypothetical protein / location=Cvel_scaffold2100:19133-27048(-) / protein_length=321 / sequence_SO=supercontig / SO=protein_coding / is_pseudo=false